MANLHPLSMRTVGFLCVLVVTVAAGCAGKSSEKSSLGSDPKSEVPMTIKLSSPAFEANSPIPKKYTDDGEDISPALKWSELPTGTKQVALIVDDPNAPGSSPFVHWLIYGLPATVEGLPEDVPNDPSLAEPVQALQGLNGFQKTGYGGPAPPKGHGVHHYHFQVYALDQALDLKPRLTKTELLKAIEGHVLALGELIGTYER